MTEIIHSVPELIAAGLASDSEQLALEQVGQQYAIAITPAIRKLINPADSRDPIALQFVPQAGELNILPEELPDPIGDKAYSPVEGIVHRYPDRVLLKAVHICPVYCRFCFRREMIGPQGEGSLTDAALEKALRYISDRKEIWEVILTGGDPLILSPRRLGKIMDALSMIDHVRVVRVHSRVPVASPERIDDALVRALGKFGKTVYVAIHANHPRELSTETRLACKRLTDAGISLLSQTVLLRDINDHVDILAELMRAFVELRIRPYYLHHPDLAPGTSHFRLSIAEGQRLVAELRGRVSGLCQPTYVLDIPGGYGKSPIGPDYLNRDSGGCLSVRDYNGNWHAYPDAAKPTV